MTTNPLDSPVYNPTIDNTTLSLITMMDSPSADTLAYYMNVVQSQPTTNMFSGVLTNPQGCNISQNQTDLINIQNQLAATYASLQAAATPTPTYTPSQSDIDAWTPWQQNYPTVAASLTEASSTLSDYQDHTDMLVSNFASNLALAQIAIGLTSALYNAANPCLGLNNFFGSLTGTGTALMSQLSSALKSVLGVVAGAIGLIVAGVAAVMGVIKNIAALVVKEVTNLATAMINGVKSGLASLLSLANSDPCTASLYRAILTPGAASTVGI